MIGYLNYRIFVTNIKGQDISCFNDYCGDRMTLAKGGRTDLVKGFFLDRQQSLNILSF